MALPRGRRCERAAEGPGGDGFRLVRHLDVPNGPAGGPRPAVRSPPAADADELTGMERFGVLVPFTG